MRKKHVLISFFTFFFLWVGLNAIYSQVGIGTTTPASTLDITATNPTGTSTNVDGILIPRVDRQRAQSMSGITTGTMIYVNSIATGSNTGTAINITSNGFYYFDGTVWQKMGSGTTDLTSQVTGTLPVSNGGTGSTSLTGMLKGNGTTPISAVTGTPWGAAFWSDANTIGSTSAGTSGQFLKSNGTSAPTWSSIINNAQSSTTSPTTTLTWTTLQSVTLTTTGSPVQIFGNTQFRETTSTTRQLFRLRITRDGTADANVIAEGITPTFGTSTYYADGNCNINWQETPSAGSHTYYLQYYFSATGTWTWFTKSLIVNEIK